MSEQADEASPDVGIDLVSAGPRISAESAPTDKPTETRGAQIRGRFVRKPTKPVAAGAVAVVVLAACGIVYATSASSAQSQYRLATVTKGTVTQSVTLSGTLAPAKKAAVSFPTSGKVSYVKVTTGQTVRAGQQLAALDTKSLRAAITAAEKTLADARLSLHQLENGQTNTQGNATARSAKVTTRSDVQQSTPSNSGGGSTAKLQQAIKRKQQAIDKALAVVKVDLAAATTACAAPIGDAAACAAAQERVMQDQSQIAELQQQQATQIDQLNKALQSATPGASGASSSGSQAATTEATGEQLAAAQAQIDAAEAGLAEAEQDLRAAVITAPISGKVLSVPFAKGETATSADAIEISGSSQYQATVQVAVDKIGSIEVGQKATVLPSGSFDALEATVASVGAAPEATDENVTYPVTLNVPGTHPELRSGASASVDIITASVEDAVAVPTSAVQTAGSFKVVNVLENGSSTPKRVTIGAVGPTYTQITDGLAPGDEVILADLDAAVPASNNTFRIPTGGGFGGGSLPRGMGR